MSMLDIYGRQYDSGATYDLEEGVPGVRGGSGPRLTAGLVPDPGTIANQAPGMTPMQAARNANVSSGGGVGTPQPGEGGPLGVTQGRDLTKDPLSSRERSFLDAAKVGMGLLPFGGIVSMAIDYNLGRQSAIDGGITKAPDSFSARVGNNMQGGMGFLDSVRSSALAGLGTARAKLDGSYNANYGNEGRNAPAPGPTEATTIDTAPDVNPNASVETAAEPTPAAPPSGYETYGSPAGWGNFGSSGAEVGGYTRGYSGVGSEGRQSNVGGGYSGAGADRDAQGGLKVTGGTIRADGRFEGPGAYADGGIIEQGTPAGLAYAAGGFIDPGIGGGEPQAQGPGLAPVGQQQAFNPQLFAGKMQNMLQNNPQMMQKLQMAVQQAVQSGQVTPQQIMQLSQIAQACLQNPQLYPKLLQMAEQQGLVPPGRLPREFNQGIVTALAAVGHGLQHMQGAQQQGPQGAMVEQPQQGGQFASGGMIHGPGTGRSDSIHTTNRTTGAPVSVSNGEYIIPAHVVEIKGKEFFDNLLRKYANVRKEA